MMGDSWKCSGCGTMWAPHVRSCETCSGAAQPARGLTVNDVHPLYEAHGSLRFRSWDKAHAVHFEHHLLPFFGALAWSDVTHAKADEYVRLRHEQKTLVGRRKVAQRTINAELNTLAAMFAWAVRNRHVTYNPLAGYSKLPEPDNPTAPVTEDDFVLLLQHAAHPALRPMITLAYETGMRRDEWRCLRWPEVDLDAKLIRLPAERTKARRARVVVLTELAVEVLRSTPRLPGCQMVFPSVHNVTAPVPKSTLHGWWVDTCENAGIKRKIHGLRHGMGREAALKKGVPLRALMDQLGHSDPEVHAGYTKMTEDYHAPLREALNRQGPRRAEIVALLPLIKSGGR